MKLFDNFWRKRDFIAVVDCKKYTQKIEKQKLIFFIFLFTVFIYLGILTSLAFFAFSFARRNSG